jgi:3-hydroxybutyryl-CoA dehydrogenase
MEVFFIEVSEDKIHDAYKNIEKVLDERIEHWGMTSGDKRSIMSRIKGSLDYQDLKGCDFVIEAIRAIDRGGKIRERKEIFHRIEEIVDKECIIATNSTTIIITELSSDLIHRERCVSLHFFVSSQEARIVEVVRSLYTSDESFQKVCQFVKMINRKMVHVQESAGLVSIRIFVVWLNEACEILMEGISNIEDIDQTMKIGFGMRMGPFEVADKMGLDKVIRWMDNIYNEFGDIRYKPNPYLRRLVRAKHIGIESGQGFYKYEENGKRIIPESQSC